MTSRIVVCLFARFMSCDNCGIIAKSLLNLLFLVICWRIYSILACAHDKRQDFCFALNGFLSYSLMAVKSSKT